MQYMLIMREPLAVAAQREDPAKAPAYWGAWMAYAQAVRESGTFVGGAALEMPAQGATLRIRNGKRQVEDGPFADAKEQLGGFFIIDVPTMEAALEWAARSPAAAEGSVEVRPVLPPPPQG